MLKNKNIERLVVIAEGLGELNDNVVFLGGAVSNLYINDYAQPSPERVKRIINFMQKLPAIK